jgi:lipooligosaccharide transport system permease protein
VSLLIGALPVFEHRLAGYRRVWRGSVFSTFLLPVLFLLGMGISVGTFVNAGGVLGIPYVDYIAPGLLASAALQVAISETTWPILGAFNWIRTYHAMRASPLEPRDLVGGELLYVGLRSGSSAVGFLVVMTLFGVVHSWWGLTVVPIALLLAASVATPVLAFAATIRTDNWFAILYRFAIIPMTLFAGVFFPVDQMPLAARFIAYVSPLWHGVELCRSATLGTPTTVPVIVHVGYLAAWAIVGYLLACWRYARKLTD